MNLRRKGCELGKGRHDCRQTIIQSILYLNCVSCNVVLLGMSDSVRLSTLPGLTTPLYALAARVGDATISKDRNEEGILDTLSRD